MHIKSSIREESREIRRAARVIGNDFNNVINLTAAQRIPPFCIEILSRHWNLYRERKHRESREYE